MTGVDVVAEWVAARGEDRETARLIAHYLADRCAGLSVASAHSSGSSSLKRDPFLTRDLGLTRRQVSAWLALIRGTRPIHRAGRTYGGRAGLVQSLATAGPTSAQRSRFERLARVAATGRLPDPHAPARGDLLTPGVPPGQLALPDGFLVTQAD